MSRKKKNKAWYLRRDDKFSEDNIIYGPSWPKEDKPSEWNTGEEVKKTCSCDLLTDIPKASIYLPSTIQAVIQELCKRNPQDEWQILLVGEEVEGTLVVNDYYIPKQTVTSASVTNDDCITKEFIEENRIVATCHSHANMNVFFSSTDDITNMGLIKWHMVTNNKGEFKGVQQVELPCARRTLKDCEIVLESMFPRVELRGYENITKREIGFHCIYPQGGYDDNY